MQEEKLEGSKVCTQCKIDKPLSEYGMRLGRKHYTCKDCLNEKQKMAYRKNKKYWLDMNRRKRAENRDRYNATKDGKPCSECGGFYPSYVMDYDHRDPDSKIMPISKMMGYSWWFIQEEIDKCDLLCSNCHRIKTYETVNRQKQHRITTDYRRAKPKCSNR